VVYGYDWLADKESSSFGPGVSHNSDLYDGQANSFDPGAFWPGDEYRDVKNDFYLGVNEDLRHPRDAVITLANGPIKSVFTNVGPTFARLDSSVTLKADLHAVQTGTQTLASDAVVPGHLVTFKLGSQTCSAETALDGKASCSLTVHGKLGKTKLEVTAKSTRAYASATASGTVDVLLPLTHPVLGPVLKGIHLHHAPLPRPELGPGSDRDASSAQAQPGPPASRRRAASVSGRYRRPPRSRYHAAAVSAGGRPASRNGRVSGRNHVVTGISSTTWTIAGRSACASSATDREIISR